MLMGPHHHELAPFCEESEVIVNMCFICHSVVPISFIRVSLCSGGWNREETSPVEQGASAEEGMNAAMPEWQKQVCGEEPLQRGSGSQL